MQCPVCQSKTETIDTRVYFDPNNDFDYVERKRRCLDEECLNRFKTIEVTVDTWSEMINE